MSKCFDCRTQEPHAGKWSKPHLIEATTKLEAADRLANQLGYTNRPVRSDSQTFTVRTDKGTVLIQVKAKSDRGHPEENF